METKRKQVGLRLDEDLLKKLAKAAQDDGRSINQQVTYYIRQALAVRPT